MDAEEAMFRAFVVPAKQQRYIELLQTKRGREKIRNALDHFKDLNPQYCHRIEAPKQFAPHILKMLLDLGAPSVCLVVSSDSALDGRQLSLRDALSEIVGSCRGSFVSCVPGRLAYFESEEMQEISAIEVDEPKAAAFLCNARSLRG